MRSSEIFAGAQQVGFSAVHLVVEVADELNLGDLSQNGAVYTDSEYESSKVLRALVASSVGSVTLATDLPERTVARAALTVSRDQCYVALLNATCETAADADLAFVREADQCPSTPRALVGWQFEVVREAARRHRRAELRSDAPVRRVLVTFGGTDPGHLSERFADEWPGGTPISATLVVGLGFDVRRATALRRRTRPGLQIIQAPVDVPALLAQHDAVVLQGGQTMIEAMHIGTPVCAVRWKHLAQGIDRAAHAGFVRVIGNESVDVGDLLTALDEHESLSLQCRMAWSAIDGRGGTRIGEALLKLGFADKPGVC